MRRPPLMLACVAATIVIATSSAGATMRITRRSRRPPRLLCGAVPGGARQRRKGRHRRPVLLGLHARDRNSAARPGLCHAKGRARISRRVAPKSRWRQNPSHRGDARHVRRLSSRRARMDRSPRRAHDAHDPAARTGTRDDGAELHDARGTGVSDRTRAPERSAQRQPGHARSASACHLRRPPSAMTNPAAAIAAMAR